jgi:hypothetical protein
MPKYNPITIVLTTKSLLEKRANGDVVNVILHSVSERLALLFDNMITAHERWNVLINRYKDNTQIKKTKITKLEI